MLALALASGAPGAAQAQQAAGSRVAPSEVANSAERPLAFAAGAPAEAALVIVVSSAALPEGLPLAGHEREAIER
ncbi:MAG TPA: leucyl aminopeptidase, partial [Croceibacterium sp.]